VYTTLEGALKAKTKAEKMLQKYYTNAFWTIVRPGGLQTAPKTGKAILTEDTTVAGVISRADVSTHVTSSACRECVSYTHHLISFHFAVLTEDTTVAGVISRADVSVTTPRAMVKCA
jgi:NAD(P)H-binding